MSKEKIVVDFYVLCYKLKNTIRTGWKDWNVKRDRLESVAEHIYGAQMIALGMYSEYDYEINIWKVILMLAIHELEETIIGDLTQFQISREEKEKMGHAAIHGILQDLLMGATIERIIMEFDERKTPEALFAYQCDKIECDIMSKIYDEEGDVDLSHQEGNETMENHEVKELLESGDRFSTMWLKFGQKKYHYDENFTAVSNYVMNNRILKNNAQ